LQRTLLDAGSAIAFFNPGGERDRPRGSMNEQLAACHGELDAYDLPAC